MSTQITQGLLAVPVSRRDHAQGSDTARLTLVEYGDYECPSCGAAYPVVKTLQAKLGDQLRFVFRNFPLTEMHPHAEQAAEAAECAGAQGKFWEMHDTLYQHQQALEERHLETYARRLQLNLNRFQEDLGQQREQARVQEDLNGGIRSGVNGTPTFYINGVRYDGSFDFDTLLTALQSVR